MDNIVNKLILITAVSYIVVNNSSISFSVFIILSAVAVSSLLEYFCNEKLSFAALIALTMIAMAEPEVLMIYPVIVYDNCYGRFKYYSFIGIIPLVAHKSSFNYIDIILVILLCSLAGILRWRAERYKNLHEKYITQRDELVESSLMLKDKIREQQERQDYDVTLATLNERNRIAREIHDNVGHILSRALLQLGAVMVVINDKTAKELLMQIKDTLDLGMNSIRSSIHNLYDESIDLSFEIRKVIKDFTFCDVKLKYEVTTDFDRQAKYNILAIIKEALNNVMKHSNATAVNINLYEHPKIYQLIIYDNGTKKTGAISDGIGLENIKSRVESLNGIVNFDYDNGFRIFISFKKGEGNVSGNSNS